MEQESRCRVPASIWIDTILDTSRRDLLGPDYRTRLQSESVRTKGGGAMSGPKNDYDRCAPRGSYSTVINAG